MGEGRLNARWRLEVRQDHHQAHHNQPHDSDNLDHREPELHLTEHFHGGEVEAEQQNNHRQRGDPVRQPREPELRVSGNRHDVRHAGDHPAEPVGPAGKVARPRAEQVRREVAEGFVFEVREQQFTHCAHHEEEHKTDDHINEDDRRPGKTDGFARPHKQPGAYGTANGDKLYMTVCEIAP